MHKIVIQLHRVITRDVELPNPHKKGLKRVFRELFPKREEKTFAEPLKYVSFDKVSEVFTNNPIVVNGKKYLKTSEVEPYDAGEGWFSYRSLYILEEDYINILRGEYYPYIRFAKEPETTEN